MDNPKDLEALRKLSLMTEEEQKKHFEDGFKPSSLFAQQSEKKWTDEQMIRCYKDGCNNSQSMLLNGASLLSAEDYLQTLKNETRNT